jgi:hypothetical protein
VAAAGIAAARVAVPGIGTRSKVAAGCRALRVNGAADFDADGALEGDTASGTADGASHVHTATIDSFGQSDRHAATRFGIEFLAREDHGIGGATRTAFRAVSNAVVHAQVPERASPSTGGHGYLHSIAVAKCDERQTKKGILPILERDGN